MNEFLQMVWASTYGAVIATGAGFDAAFTGATVTVVALRTRANNEYKLFNNTMKDRAERILESEVQRLTRLA